MKKHNVLVVVDYQKDFVDGSLGFEKAVKLEENIQNKVTFYLEKGWPIIFTLDTHDAKNYNATREGRNLPISHCVKGEEGWKLYGSLEKYMDHASSNITLVEKETFGALGLDFMKEEEIEAIEIVGIVTNMCVISNAVTLQSCYPKVDIVVDAACCASFNNDLHEKALDVMEGLQIKVVNR